jgi:hypothetical protein
VFGAGFAGGFAAEILALYELRHNVTSELPVYLKSPFYWTISIVMAVIGGGLTCLYGIGEVQALLAVNIGASAPLILRSLFSAVPAKTKIG